MVMGSGARQALLEIFRFCLVEIPSLFDVLTNDCEAGQVLWHTIL